MPILILFLKSIGLFLNYCLRIQNWAIFFTSDYRQFSHIKYNIQDDKPGVFQLIIQTPFVSGIIKFFSDFIRFIAENIFEEKSVLGTIIILTLLIYLIFATISNFIKRRRLEKDLSREYYKIDRRVEESTKKLRLANNNLLKDIEKLKKSEHYLHQIKQSVDTMKLGVTITDTFGKIIYVNHANAEMHGYKEEELIGKYSNIFTSNVLREPIDFEALKKIQGKIRKSSNLRKDGSIFPVQMISNLVKDDKNQVIAIVTTYEDITERTRSEEALMNSEENFRRIFENIQDVYYEVDIDGIIREISPSVSTISNYTRDELLGKPMNDLYFNSRQRDNFLKALKKDEQVHDYEISLKGNDNNPVPCSVTAKLLLDENGLPAKIIGSMRNITERKKIEEERTKTLKELQTANKELRDFSYVTSHDLKSPLRAINTLANWISLDYADKFDENGKEQMNLLLGRVERMHQLIEGIFQYSSLGSYQGKIEKVVLDDLLPKILEKLNPPENIEIKIKPELPVIDYEKDRIEQVFQHLIKNAIQFITNPKGKIEVGFVEDGPYWKFHVSDNGPGIEKRHFERIFEMFKTLQSRDDLESSGMGLTIVKKIIEMNNGKIWVESKFGKGSTFFFTIPRSKKLLKETPDKI